MSPEIRSPWDRHRCAVHPAGKSMTDQSHAEASDINFIVHRFARSGQLPPATRTPFYGDVTNLQGPLQERLAWASDILERHQAATNKAQTPPETPPTTPPAAPQAANTPPPATPVASNP